jgi:predicted Holliday junction resolvase-like endonuclease
MDIWHWLLLAIIGIIVFVLVRLDHRIAEMKANHLIEIGKAREDALNISRRVIKGQISEQMAPFLEGFPYKASNLKFFGNQFDFFCINDMSEARDTDIPLEELVFIDIKTGKAQLSKIQRKIRDAVVDGRVFWETITIDENGKVSSIKRATKKPDKTIDTSSQT